MGDTVEEGTGVNENHTTEMNNSTMHPHIYIYIDIHIYIYMTYLHIKSMNQLHVQT